MKPKFVLAAFLTAVFFPFFVGCGSWTRQVEPEAYDFLLGKSVFLPLPFDYGFQGNPYSDTVVSNQDLPELGRAVSEITLQDRSCRYEIASQCMLVYVPVDSQATAVLLFRQTGADSLDSPYSQYEYRYLVSDMFVQISGAWDSVSSAAFPSHMMAGDFQFITAGESYETQGTIDDFYQFYWDYLTSYGQSPEAFLEKGEDTLLLQGALVHSFSHEEPEVKIQLNFSQSGTGNSVSVSVIE